MDWRKHALTILASLGFAGAEDPEDGGSTAMETPPNAEPPTMTAPTPTNLYGGTMRTVAAFNAEMTLAQTVGKYGEKLAPIMLATTPHQPEDYCLKTCGTTNFE